MELKDFLIEAKKAGYANGDKSVIKKKENHSETISFQKGDFLYNDKYFGGEPYGGREVVFKKGRPIWMMIYYGKVLNQEKISARKVYSFLRKAISKIPKEAPFRGDKEFIEENLKYQNNWNGDIDYFNGEETIYLDNEKIYEARYNGGLVDLRSGIF